MQANYRWVGAAVGLLLTSPIGVRIEARFHPFVFGRLRPWLGAGTTLFFPAVGLRGALGLEAAIIKYLRVGIDVAVEGYVNNPAGFHSPAVLLGASAGVAL